MRCVFERRADREGYLRDVPCVSVDGTAEGAELMLREGNVLNSGLLNCPENTGQRDGSDGKYAAKMQDDSS